MTSTTALLLNDIRNIFLLSITIIYIIFGTIGSLLNIILFRKRAVWSISPCIPFLFLASITNLIDIYATIRMRMLVSFKITPTFYSSVACKLQLYFYYTSFCLSSWFMVGCCIDRFLSSSRNANIRFYSNMRITNRTIAIIILLGYSQVLYCFDANQVNRSTLCSTQNDFCSMLDTIYTFFFQSIGPPVFILIFGIGTFFHIHNNRQIQPEIITGTTLPISIRKTKRINDRDILLVVAIQVMLYLFCLIPFLAM